MALFQFPPKQRSERTRGAIWPFLIFWFFCIKTKERESRIKALNSNNKIVNFDQLKYFSFITFMMENIYITIWNGLSKTPKIPKSLINFFIYFLERKHYKANKKIISNLNHLITNVDNTLRNEFYYRQRFPLFIESWQHFNISMKDILICHNQILKCKNKDDKNLLNRTLALFLYEFLEDFQKLLNKKYRRELETVPNNDSILNKFDELKRTYKVTNENYKNNIQDIRHQTIAHKQKESSKDLLNSINHLDELDIKTAYCFIGIMYGCYEQFRINLLNHIIKNKDEIATIPYPNGRID